MAFETEALSQFDPQQRSEKLTRQMDRHRIRSSPENEILMKRLLDRIPSRKLIYAGLMFAASAIAGTASAAAVADDAAVQQADHALVAALGKGDKAAAEKMFDTQLMWTNSAGDTFGRARVVAALPKPMLGDESVAKLSEKGYGPDLAAVQVANGKMHVLRIWAKRPGRSAIAGCAT